MKNPNRMSKWKNPRTKNRKRKNQRKMRKKIRKRVKRRRKSRRKARIRNLCENRRTNPLLVRSQNVKKRKKRRRNLQNPSQRTSLRKTSLKRKRNDPRLAKKGESAERHTPRICLDSQTMNKSRYTLLSPRGRGEPPFPNHLRRKRVSRRIKVVIALTSPRTVPVRGR